MSKKNQGEVGFITTLIHDSMNNVFAKEEQYHLINSIDCYYTDTDIIGFFPCYKDSSLTKTINKDSYYPKFKEELDKIKSQCIIDGVNLKHEVTNFIKGESISYIKAVYDENDQKILAIRMATQKKVYSYGNHTLFNKREFIMLTKKESFITGLKTSYLKDRKGVPHLSYIRGHFDKEDNFEKYYTMTHSSSSASGCGCCGCCGLCSCLCGVFLYPFAFIEKVFQISSKIADKIIKGMIILFMFLLPFIMYIYTSHNLYNGDIKYTPYNNEYTLTGNDKIKIYTDVNGFSHIKANSNKDGYFALGFEHAKNRLWLMDMNRRISRGKVSEILGKKGISIDRTIRSFGLNEMAEINGDFVRKNSNYTDELNAYISGINFYAENFVLPIEYWITWSNFEKWTVEDTIAILDFYGIMLSHDWNMEVWYKTMEDTMGKEFADMVMTYRDENYPFWNETIVNEEELLKMGMHKYRKRSEEILKEERDIKKHIKKEQQKENTKKEEKKDDIEIEDAQETITDSILQSEGASNCWVIDGKYTKSGKPLLSNDPHLPNGMPSLFYIAKLYLPDNTLTGAFLPGTPFLATGSNTYLSWGLTTENSDNTDICEEIIEDDYYIFNKKKYELKTTQEEIKVRGADPIYQDTKWTVNGPLISKTIQKVFLLLNKDFNLDVPMSLRSPLYFYNFTNLDFYFILNHAHSSKEFLPYVDKQIVPNYNLHWASIDGEIGWIPIGKIAVKNYVNRLCRGYTSEDDVVKYISRRELPRLISPSKGYIVTANNKMASFNYTYELRGHHNHVRAYRIREMIEEHIRNNTLFDVNETAMMINDVKDSLAEYLLPKLLKIFERNFKYTIRDKRLYKELKQWNYTFDFNSTGATIYSVLEKEIALHLVSKKLEDDQTAKGMLNYLHYWNFISGLIDRIYKGERVDLKQCVHQSGNTNCEKYLLTIFDNLETTMKKEGYIDSLGIIKEWGQVMFQDFTHTPFDKVPLLNKLFSRKLYTSGNRNTVKIARGSYNSNKGDFVSKQSANLKFVCDMEEPTKPYLTIPGGNSGNFIGKYYDNLMYKHENAELIQIEDVDFNKIKSDSVIEITEDKIEQ